jgi:hypothetical protein
MWQKAREILAGQCHQQLVCEKSVERDGLDKIMRD